MSEEASIDELRRQIDQVDRRLLELLNQRIELVNQIGRLKQRQGLELYDPTRERRIMERLTKANPGPLSDAAVVRLFERIIDESRSLERATMEALEEEPTTE